MGCGGSKDENPVEIDAYKYPVLICFFESKNEDQKNYCIKLKDNISMLQNEFKDDEETMMETLNKVYELLND